MSSEFAIGGHSYRAGRMDAFKQLAVARRLGPFVKAFYHAIAASNGGNPIEAYQPILDAIGGMSDADAEFVLNACLATVSRQQPGGAWAPILPAPGQIMFEDITPSVMLDLTGRVLEAHRIGDFFSGLLSLSGPAVGMGKTSNT